MRADIHDGQGARNAPCNGPNTDARDQLSPDHYIRLAPHGRSIQKYMVKRCGPPSQGWGTFLRNHAPDILPELSALDHPAKLTERDGLVLSAPGALFAPGVPPRHLRCLARRGPISVI